jgi:phosphatidylglycerophosphate synthase
VGREGTGIVAGTMRENARATTSLLQRSRKQGPTTELICEVVYRPVAHLVVLALLPLRIPPPAVVVAAGSVGLLAAAELARGQLVAAAALVIAKTVLDNADGQLARASGRVTALGRYLDSETDLLVNAALFVALAHVTGRLVVAAVGFAALTLLLSANFKLRMLYRSERGEHVQAMPQARGVGAVLQRVYAVVYAPQDRLVESFVEWRLRRIGADRDARLAYHDRTTIAILHNLGLSGQMTVLAVTLAFGRPGLYLVFVLGCLLALVPLELRRERRAVRAGRASSHPARASEPCAERA